MKGLWVRVAVLGALLGSICLASADELRAPEARRFIAGKHFAYSCFDGTKGAGRAYADGSVAGFVSIRGAAPRFVTLPAGTLRVQGDQYCAHLKGLPFSPCFNVDRTSQLSFRGSISGLGFAYCDFSRRSTRADLLHSAPMRLRPSHRPSVANATAD